MRSENRCKCHLMDGADYCDCSIKLVVWTKGDNEYLERDQATVPEVVAWLRPFLTSPAAVEKAAFRLWVADSKATSENYVVWNYLTEDSREYWRELATSVLSDLYYGESGA